MTEGLTIPDQLAELNLTPATVAPILERLLTSDGIRLSRQRRKALIREAVEAILRLPEERKT